MVLTPPDPSSVVEVLSRGTAEELLIDDFELAELWETETEETEEVEEDVARLVSIVVVV